MIVSPFPEYIGFSVKVIDDLDSFELHLEETRILGPGAGDKRRNEFMLGRSASFSALKQVGFSSPPPVLRGNMNEPLWPRGFIGSISHSTDIALCAVCPDSEASGIGIDIEELDGEIEDGMFELVCNPSELKWVRESRRGESMRFRMIFSAKEAAYKAFFPLVHNFMDFRDVELKWTRKNSGFSGILLKPAGKHLEPGFEFRVNISFFHSYVFSHIVLPVLVPSR